MIRFGSMSITLLVAGMYGLLFASLLWFNPQNRWANRFLSALLIVISLRLLPYIIGYAGFYEAYPWLSFLPWNLSLAIGPLLYLHVHHLMRDRVMPGWGWHFVPTLLQFAYYCMVFAQPLAFKDAWDMNWHVPWFGPIELASMFVSIAVYWWLSYRHLQRYRDWLEREHSQMEEHRLDWLRHFLLALGLTLLIWLGLVAFDRLVAKLDYFQQFPFYVWLGLLVYYLGTEGYRHARHVYPVYVPVAEPAAPEPESAPAPSVRPAVDWTARAQDWRQKLIAAGWWRDPELSLPSLARKLGTNSSDLSRAINDGLGMNFNELINRLRVDAVAAELARTPDTGLLDLALACGFSSKASFNRCFKRFTGKTPSEFRADLPKEAD
ncbi:MAG: AraC family transcriptional regulator [Ahniella sp.]|nr:AraC family transcriptional regulator [Ahniella sp.]